MYIPSNQYFSVMHRALDASSMRQEVLANNIANIDTPEFKRSDVTFEAQLAIALKPEKPEEIVARKTNPLHFDFKDTKKIKMMQVKPYIVREMDTDYRNDLNNVDPDYEASELAKNTMQYSALTTLIKDEFKSLSEVINKTPAGAK